MKYDTKRTKAAVIIAAAFAITATAIFMVGSASAKASPQEAQFTRLCQDSGLSASASGDLRHRCQLWMAR